MAEQKDRTKTGLLAGGGAALGAALAIMLARKTEAAPPTDEAVIKLLESIAESGVSIDTDTTDIIEVLNRIAVALGVTVLENPSDITSFRILVSAVNTPVHLPDREIPHGMELVVKALPTNRGLIYVANSRPEAMNINSCYQLLANEAIEYTIKNCNTVWLNATRAGEGVCCTVEQKGAG